MTGGRNEVAALAFYDFAEELQRDANMHRRGSGARHVGDAMARKALQRAQILDLGEYDPAVQRVGANLRWNIAERAGAVQALTRLLAEIERDMLDPAHVRDHDGLTQTGARIRARLSELDREGR